MHTYTDTYMHTYTHIHTYTHTHIYIYTHTHTYIYTYIHTDIQYSDNDNVLIEIHKGSNTFYAASVCMEYNEQIDTKLQTIEQRIEFTKSTKLIMAIDSNVRSTIWHDTTTNNRGKMMEEFIARISCI